MAKFSEASSRLGRVLAMFPGRTQEIRRLAMRDPAFRDLCEDLEEAHASLSRLVILFGQEERPEFEEYRTVIADLEKEIRVQLESQGS